MHTQPEYVLAVLLSAGKTLMSRLGSGIRSEEIRS